MTTHIITRRLEFDAGHRVYKHESKCAHVHGHRYVVEVSCRSLSSDLDNIGRVVDFSVIKAKFGKWIDDNLDHGMILFKDDPLCEIWEGFGTEMPDRVGKISVLSEIYLECLKHIGNQKHFIMDSNPTAENMAELLYKKANDMLFDDGVEVCEIVVWETPNCKASYSETV